MGAGKSMNIPPPESADPVVAAVAKEPDVAGNQEAQQSARIRKRGIGASYHRFAPMGTGGTNDKLGQ